MKFYYFVYFFLGILSLLVLESCASERQGLVCEEIEYRLNSMSYSPDQRYYMEEELRTCREDEAKKKNTSSKKQSIYERYANQDTKKTHTAGDTIITDISVSDKLQDTTQKENTSIYERFENSDKQE